jgi:spore germination protein GerM
MNASRVRWMAVLLIAGVAACGVPTHQSAKKVEAKDVPFGLLDKDSGATTSARSGEEAVTLFFARDGRLVPVSRPLKRPVTPEALLGALREGPTTAEVAAGVRSALPALRAFRSISLAGGTATVDLVPRFTSLSSTDQLLALAQIVYTLTARPGIGQVRFTLQGASTEVPRANGSLTSAAVSRDDYASLAGSG